MPTWQLGKTRSRFCLHKACTQLNAPYSGYSVSQMENDANYKKLPVTLKNMVKKMLAGGSWKENNANSLHPTGGPRSQSYTSSSSPCPWP